MLGNEKIMSFVGVSDADKARAFYRDTLGLTMLYEDGFALVFDVGGIMLRVTRVGTVQPQPYTVLGWQVKDATAAAHALANAGVQPERKAEPGIESGLQGCAESS